VFTGDEQGFWASVSVQGAGVASGTAVNAQPLRFRYNTKTSHSRESGNLHHAHEPEAVAFRAGRLMLEEIDLCTDPSFCVNLLFEVQGSNHPTRLKCASLYEWLAMIGQERAGGSGPGFGDAQVP
jgi:hypothetical protein